MNSSSLRKIVRKLLADHGKSNPFNMISSSGVTHLFIRNCETTELRGWDDDLVQEILNIKEGIVIELVDRG